MAELHVIGELKGASGFNSAVFCKWGITAGRSWELIEGFDNGQTHVDYPAEDEEAVWAHPLDIHYHAKGLSGWPKLYFQVWSRDEHGRNDIAGYSFCHIPTSPGMYSINCPTWVPEGPAKERLSRFFTGGGARVKYEDVVHSASDRFRLQTAASGIIHLQFGVMFKDFDKHNIHTG